MIIQKICANTVVKESGMVLWNDRNKLRFEVSRACQQKGGFVACIVCDSWRERVATHRISKGLNFIFWAAPPHMQIAGPGIRTKAQFQPMLKLWILSPLCRARVWTWERVLQGCRHFHRATSGTWRTLFYSESSLGIQRKFMELRGGLNIQDQGAINPLVCFYNIDIFVITILKIETKIAFRKIKHLDCWAKVYGESSPHPVL